MTPSDSDTLFIGLDAGGSKTELLSRRSGSDDLTLKGPAANLQRLGAERAAEVLAALVAEAAAPHAGAALAVCAGVSGAGSPAERADLAERVRQKLRGAGPGAAALRVVHDAEIALEAAFEGASGLIIIAGTGSVVFARAEDGALLRAGGWGYLLGDEGSGHTLGLRALRALLVALDGGPATRLQALLAERCGLSTRAAVIRRVYQEDWPAQQVAPLVLEAAAAGDAVAQGILKRQTELLAEQAGWLASRDAAITPQIALLGGLTGEAPYHRALEKALGERLPGWTVRQPTHRPVIGALRLAMQRA